MEFVQKTRIEKGWSKDKKYCAIAKDGRRYLFRVSDLSQYEAKRMEFQMMQRTEALGVPMCQPIEFGTCQEGVYSVQSWIDGTDAEELLPGMTEKQQYAYGYESGQILRKIHSIPAPESQPDWELRFNRKIDRNIRWYRECPIHYENGEAFIAYINANRHLLKGRPQAYQHGDYHVGNMMIDTHGKLQIIDFNRNDYGDPWEEFNRIVWCGQAAPVFAAGMVDGYFEKDIPAEFWKLLALYISSNMLSAIPWAIPFGQGEVDVMRKQAKDVLGWYDNMQNPIPSWYRDV